jgi:hypothetical protein
MLRLRRRGRDVMLLRCLFFCRSRCGRCAAGASVVTHIVVDDRIVHHDGFVDVDVRGEAAANADIHCRRVVKE